MDPPPEKKKTIRKLFIKILEINLKDVWKPMLFRKLFKIKKSWKYYAVTNKIIREKHALFHSFILMVKYVSKWQSSRFYPE